VKDQFNKQESKTPRTDAALKWCPQCPVLGEKDGDVCDAQFARSLELELNETKEQLTSLLRDKARLDWLDKNRSNHIYEHFKFNPSLAATQKKWRDAIDAAMKEKE